MLTINSIIYGLQYLFLVSPPPIHQTGSAKSANCHSHKNQNTRKS